MIIRCHDVSEFHTTLFMYLSHGSIHSLSDLFKGEVRIRGTCNHGEQNLIKSADTTQTHKYFLNDVTQHSFPLGCLNNSFHLRHFLVHAGFTLAQSQCLTALQVAIPFVHYTLYTQVYNHMDNIRTEKKKYTQNTQKTNYLASQTS